MENTPHEFLFYNLEEACLQKVSLSQNLQPLSSQMVTNEHSFSYEFDDAVNDENDEESDQQTDENVRQRTGKKQGKKSSCPERVTIAKDLKKMSKPKAAKKSPKEGYWNEKQEIGIGINSTNRF